MVYTIAVKKIVLFLFFILKNFNIDYLKQNVLFVDHSQAFICQGMFKLSKAFDFIYVNY